MADSTSEASKVVAMPPAGPARADRRATGDVARVLVAAAFLLPVSVAAGGLDATARSSDRHDAVWDARVPGSDAQFDRDFDLDLGRALASRPIPHDASAQLLDWSITDPLRTRLSYELLDGLRIKGNAVVRPSAEAWQAMVDPSSSGAAGAGASGDLTGFAAEVLDVDATLELVVDLRTSRSSMPWRIGIGGGWSSAERVFQTDGGDGDSFARFLDGTQQTSSFDRDASGVPGGECVVWLRIGREF
jgi:hypothetical protein